MGDAKLSTVGELTEKTILVLLGLLLLLSFACGGWIVSMGGFRAWCGYVMLGSSALGVLCIVLWWRLAQRHGWWG